MKFISLSAALAAAMFFAFPNAQAAEQPVAGALAAAYCVTNGGTVQERLPYFGTNGSNPLRLAGERAFCQFTSKKDGSHINLLLDTLYSEKPNLAALAYYAKVPLGSGCNGNPASCYCTQLGGTDLFGGINFNGGGWVLKTDSTDVLDACIFPDLSSIDSWGLAYHSAGIVRGENLAKVLRTPNPYKKMSAAKAARAFAAARAAAH
jgi:putative hemolysin